MLALYESPEARRARKRAKRTEALAPLYEGFGQRLRDTTAEWERQHGRKLSRIELAKTLREKTLWPVTPRIIGQWYRGRTGPRRQQHMIELAKFLHVQPGWLLYGEGNAALPTRGVYDYGDSLGFYDNEGNYLGAVHLGTDADKDAAILKCRELLDAVNPVRALLRLEP